MEDPKMWRVNHDVGQAVFVRLQGDVLSAQLRLKALLEVSDSQTAALTESGYVEKVIEELEALGMAQQKLYALKSVQPHQNMPRGARTPHDRGPADDTPGHTLLHGRVYSPCVRQGKPGCGTG